MEGLVKPNQEFWKGKRVFLTGHTGFKGSWLSLWLAQMGSEVHGFALDPYTEPSHFEVCRTSQHMASDTRADLADRNALATAMRKARPEIIFHLAAQPLVRESYSDPLGTFRTNVMGTAHVLEQAREHIADLSGIIIVTTDKVYHNPEGPLPFVEADPLGGEADPYSASKAAAEIVTSTWRKSYFQASSVPVASARAGNVVGGGDWSADRLVPDCIRAFSQGEHVSLRFPGAVRPWQHVIEPLAGYLMLAESLASDEVGNFAKGFNFGPDRANEDTVGDVAQMVASIWGGSAEVKLPAGKADEPHEAGLLRLDSTLAKETIGWQPNWSLKETLGRTVQWYRAHLAGNDMHAHTLADISEWMS